VFRAGKALVRTRPQPLVASGVFTDGVYASGRDLVELAALQWSLMGDNLYENRLVWRGAIDIGTSPAVEALHEPKPRRPGELAPLRFAARANRSDVPRQDGTGSHEPSSSSCSPIRCDWGGRRRSGRQRIERGIERSFDRCRDGVKSANGRLGVGRLVGCDSRRELSALTAGGRRCTCEPRHGASRGPNPRRSR
jgi:hypothetical protein